MAARRDWMACGVALGCLLLAACSTQPGTPCPMFRIASEVTVDASAFFASHNSAFQLCANGMCVTPRAGSPRPAVVFLHVGRPGRLDVRVRITSRQGTVLVHAVSSVPVRHVVQNAACGQEADLGSVTVTRSGALTTG